MRRPISCDNAEEDRDTQALRPSSSRSRSRRWSAQAGAAATALGGVACPRPAVRGRARFHGSCNWLLPVNLRAEPAGAAGRHDHGAACFRRSASDASARARWSSYVRFLAAYGVSWRVRAGNSEALLARFTRGAADDAGEAAAQVVPRLVGCRQRARKHNLCFSVKAFTVLIYRIPGTADSSLGFPS